ncbi:MAG: hypothetical protein RLZZ584_4580, partial [Pseudomonadota bacterium]
MNAALPTMPAATAAPRPAARLLMSGADYRESLRRVRPTVYVDGQLI